MVRRRGKKFKKDKKRIDDRDKPGGLNIKYFDFIKKNDSFEKYYKAQNLIQSEEEWDEFMSFLKQPLPSAFRINSSCFGQTQVLKNIVESKDFGDLNNTEENENSESVITKLKWYPNNLAYQMNLSRVEIRKSEKLQNLHNFLMNESENGYISRQEAVSMIPPIVLDIQPHHKILDMCAAPGSKTSQLIEFLHKNDEKYLEKNSNDLPPLNGVIIANDLNNTRCYMLVHQSKRLKSPSFIITNHDASNIPNFYRTLSDNTKQSFKFDNIVCDVPCSGDGTLRKNIEIWSKWTVSSGNHFHGIQIKIARRAAELLQKDGYMVYSTCSFNPMENEAVIATLLNEAKGCLQLVDIVDKLKNLKFREGLEHWVVMQKDLKVVNNISEVDENYVTQIRENMFPPANVKELNLKRCVRVFPHFQNTGGFFIALLKKTTQKMPWEKNFDNQDTDCEKVLNLKKKLDKRAIGFREDPFFFIDENDPDCLEIKNYYNISEKFPFKQLIYRSEKVKKNLYFLTENAINILKTNENRIKFINAGVRMFTKIQDKVATCTHRLTQEGLYILYPYLDKQKIINISKKEFEKLLLSDKYVLNENLEPETQEKLNQFQSGCIVMQFITDIKQDDNTFKPMYLPFTAWKGKSTVRPFVSKQERVHFSRICGFDISDYELERKKQFDSKQQRRTDRLEKNSKLKDEQVK